MTRHRRLGITCVILLAAAVGRTSMLHAQTLPASAWNSEAATAAAKANPELAAALSKEIGGTPEQAAGAAGAVFGAAKTKLKADEFSQIAKAVPGMDLLLKAAPSAAAAAGPSDPVSQLAGTVAGIPAVAAAFSKMGIAPALAPKVASALASYVTKTGGANLGALLANVLK